MRTPTWRFAVAHGRPRAHSLAQRQHPSRLLPARLEPSGFAAERRPHTCRIPTAIQWQTRRVKDRQPDDPGPCRRCASALSSAADAPAYISLGSHAKSGPPMRRSPRRAVPCGHRHGASLTATDATNPAARRRGSNHPDLRMRGWNRVLPAGENRIANGWGLLRRGACADGEPRIGSSGQAGSGQRYQRLSAPQDLRSCRMCSSRTPNLGCAWVAHRDAGFSDTACT